MQCLLIDDDIPTLDVLSDYINWGTLGIERVSRAQNIADAKEILMRHTIEIILCDIEMPKGTGIDLIKWVRERQFDCVFIFLTCHESFEFASIAISYHADAYLIKPFDKVKVEYTLKKAIDEWMKKTRMMQFSKFGELWVKNKQLVEQSFWSDLLFARISPRMDLIQGEIKKRDLSIDTENGFCLLLISISVSDIEKDWQESVFTYAYSNLTSEILLEEVNPRRVVNYRHDGRHYNAVIIEGNLEQEEIERQSRQLIQYCRQYFRCTATCYISDLLTMDKMEQARKDLESSDRKNLIFRGSVHARNLEYRKDEPYELDVNELERLFLEGEKVRIVNKLKRELEKLVSENKLDMDTLHAIKQDFMQIVYTLLYKNEVYAHKLFSDPASRELLQKSEHGVMELMKWASFATNRTIDSLRMVKQSDNVIEKAKRFIHANFNQDLNLEQIAASVYLSPDYLAKIFKSETGLSIHDYLNNYRIQAAKHRLIHTNDSISQIAVDTGFYSMSYFSTVFKKWIGETPSDFRKHYTAKTPESLDF